VIDQINESKTHPTSGKKIIQKKSCMSWVVHTNPASKELRKTWSHDFDENLNMYVWYPGLSKDGRWFWVCTMESGAIQIQSALRKLNRGKGMRISIEVMTEEHEPSFLIGSRDNAVEVRSKHMNRHS
jgi:hypothetical protein